MPNNNVLTDEQREVVQACVDVMLHRGISTDKDHPERIALDRAQALLAAHPGTPEPRAEETDPFRELLEVLIDIYDDQRNNAPEDRCYTEGAWSEVLGEVRALLAPLPDPARVAAESPDWIKNALPPESV